MVHLRVHVEPVLDALGEILGDVRQSVGVPPEVLVLRILQQGLQTVVDVRIHLDDAHEVDRMGELVDEDVLRVVLVDLVAEDVLLRAGGERELEVAAQAAGPEVPVQGGVVDQVMVLRDVGGAFVAAHHRHAGARLAEGVHHLVGQHGGHRPQRVVAGDERAVRAAPGRAQRNAVHVHIFLVPGIQVQGIRRSRDHAGGNPERFHEVHFRLLRGRPAAGQHKQARGKHGDPNLLHTPTSCKCNGSRSGRRGSP